MRKNELSKGGIERITIDTLASREHQVGRRSVPMDEMLAHETEISEADEFFARMVYPAATISFPGRSTSWMVPSESGL